MGITRGIITRTGYIGVGLGIGLAFAVHSANAAPPASLRPLASSPCNTSAPHGTYAVDPSTGETVTASHLHVDTENKSSKAGHEFLIIHLLIHNGGKKAASYNPLYFALHGARDQVNYSEALDFGLTPMSSGQLAPGQSVAGDIAFDVPANGQKYILQWDPSYGFNVPITVPINP